VWAGTPELRAEAWVWDEDGTPAGSRVVARLRGPDGTVLAAQEWTLPDAVEHPRGVGPLTVDADAVPVDAPVVWDVTWSAADGTELDREIVLATTGADFAPLLDLGPAVLGVAVEPDAVLVTHLGGPLVIGLQVSDARPGYLAGPLAGDPRPLLPGESRRLAGRRTGCARLLVESWNTEPVYVDVPPKEMPE
jgi:hypothetical protein